MRAIAWLAAALAVPAYAAVSAPLVDWPHIASAVRPDARIEARVRQIVAGMSLAQKVGQMTQAEIQSVTPEDIRRYYIGSVLNGGGSWPGKNKHAAPADWVALADQFYDASMQTDMPVKVPVIWGIDAIHGHSNVYGATLYPHNVGIGAAHDPTLAARLGAAVGKAVRATGIDWVFAPTLAVARDLRWGRSYESFSEDPLLVKQYASAYVRGLQGNLHGDATVIATAKHFMGDGGTDQGRDQGDTLASRADMINIHGQGYYGALAAGVQTVMASFNSWNGQKLHGDRALLTDALKDKMGFDGFVVSDWNGIGQVKGCTDDSCAQAINAGVDMVMVPTAWKAFIANTIKQVEAGEIPMARIDDAVTRIVRVKLRAGLFEHKPSASAYAGKMDALQDRALAREMVRKSLVLLKNDGNALPLVRGKRLLVVGEGADSLPLQAGGWSLTWQGTDNTNSDYPNGDTILAGIQQAAGADKVVYRADARGVNVADFDAVIAVLAESPFAEFGGDIGPTGTLRHTSRYPQDLAVLQAVAGKGRPVITVLLAGRPLYVNDLMNLSDSFVAAWLPGTEGKGVADVLFKGGAPFTGTLSFTWPKAACPGSALFKPGYGLRYGKASHVGLLPLDGRERGCGTQTAYPVYIQGNRATWPLTVTSGVEQRDFGRDLFSAVKVGAVTLETAEVNNQQDGKRIVWSGPARVEARRTSPSALPDFAAKDGALRFDAVVESAPAGPVRVGMNGATVDLSGAFAAMAGKSKRTITIPLSCFTARGLDPARLTTAFSIESDGAFTAAIANIQIVGGAAREADALQCAALR